MKNANFRVANDAGQPTFYIYDDIGPEWLGMVSAETVTAELNKLGAVASINVRINSPGGDVFEAFAIYNAFTRHGAKINVDVDGLAASAASIVAMAGNSIRVASNAMLMIHNAWTVTAGNKDDHAKAIETLAKVDATLAKTYSARTGLALDDVVSMMNAETWLNAQECLSKGFCDEIGQPLQATAKVANSRYRNTPPRYVIDPAPAPVVPPPMAPAKDTIPHLDMLRLRAEMSAREFLGK